LENVESSGKEEFQTVYTRQDVSFSSINTARQDVSFPSINTARQDVSFPSINTA